MAKREGKFFSKTQKILRTGARDAERELPAKVDCTLTDITAEFLINRYGAQHHHRHGDQRENGDRAKNRR
jgi:hypothetical protein